MDVAECLSRPGPLLRYVDLNPVRANLCDTLEASHHTSARQRINEIETKPATASHALAPVLGNRGLSVSPMSQAEYLGLVDFTGRKIRADKCGAIIGAAPAVVTRMGEHSERWAHKNRMVTVL